MSEELNNHRPYTAAELSEMLHNERARWAEEVNALGHAIGFDRVQQAGSILEAVRQLASRPALAVHVPDGYALVPLEPTQEMLKAAGLYDDDTININSGADFARDIYRAMLAAAPAPAPAPATVATEDGAQDFDGYMATVDWNDEPSPYEVAERAFAAGRASAKNDAVEAVAQGGGVDVEKVMALLKNFHRKMRFAESANGLATMGRRELDAQRWAEKEIRALLASPAPVGGVVRPDCGTCSNRGRVDGLSQETHCEHCCWRESWRTDHYSPAPAATKKDDRHE